MNLNNLTQQTESMPTNTKKPTRIVVMGDLGVGKSGKLAFFCNQTFTFSQS